MPDRTHIFVTDEGDYGFSLVSPQLPGFAFGRPTRSELLSDYQEALRREGVRGEVLGHWQIRGTAADGQEYVIRWATDATGETRQEVGSRVVSILTDAASVKQIAGQHQPDRLGVLNFVCCLASDTIGWLVEQLDSAGDVVVAVVAVADRMVFGIDIASDGMFDWPSIAESGLSLDDTIGSLMTSDGRAAFDSEPLLLRV